MPLAPDLLVKRRMRSMLVLAVLLVAREASADCNKPSGWDIVADIIDAVAGSSSSSSSSTSSAPATAEAACFDANGNMTECAHSSSHPVELVIGTAMRSLPSALGTASGTIDHEGESFGYRASGAAHVERAAVVSIRVTTPIVPHIYLGGEVEGGVFKSHTAVEMTESGLHGTPSINPSTLSATYAGLAVAGVGGNVGPFEVGAEAAGGVRLMSYSFDSSYGACNTEDSLHVAMPVLETRVRAAVEVYPDVTLGGTYGRSVIDRAWLGGIYIGWRSN